MASVSPFLRLQPHPRASQPVAAQRRSAFADAQTRLYFSGGACGHRRLRGSPQAAAAAADFSSSSSSRRARVLQQAASVEETLRRLDAGGDLPGLQAAFPLAAQAAAPSAASQRRAKLARTSSSSSSSSESSSESEGEGPAALRSRYSRQLQAELAARRDAAAANLANILPAGGLASPPPAAGAAAGAAAARVCTGKKCSAAGAGSVLAAMAAVPGVAAAASPKCMGKCKQCVAVKLASPGAQEVLYTGVTPANAAAVAASHQAQQQQAQRRVAAQPCA